MKTNSQGTNDGPHGTQMNVSVIKAVMIARLHWP